ncbi:hypothetical protein AC578_5959 [Pseudocercospora eumusae]|uniref:BTB domain-containing protein n=1 Tax=Pseudocercospora eumusae TaxID=321146 RepID=A0A139HIG6_9PEZI|nr:hypothetical protein AC578_5959 [Pseudocercospora eumusae]KXT02193.1 hypothetical protein AC578_5959 [Pseudocercospora eumusae]KXT02196.1 hypothetical protein AC578_5959 [Pseudocercospora eumusae]KXT02197.1 hypothetical protein AC578_5959 [Pseudocercospora eumusae]
MQSRALSFAILWTRSLMMRRSSLERGALFKSHALLSAEELKGSEIRVCSARNNNQIKFEASAQQSEGDEACGRWYMTTMLPRFYLTLTDSIARANTMHWLQHLQFWRTSCANVVGDASTSKSTSTSRLVAQPPQIDLEAMATNEKRSRPEGTEGMSSKRTRLNYNRTITIKVGRQIRPIEFKAQLEEVRKTFTICADSLVKNSSYFRKQIEQNPGNTTFDLHDVDPEEFRTYFDWIREGCLNIEMVESASARMLRKLSNSLDVQAKHDGAVLFRLCRLFLMDENLMQDDEFSDALADLLDELLEKHAENAVRLTVTQGQQIWSIAGQLFPKHQCKVAKWMAADLTATSLQDSQHLLAPTLFNAIQGILPREVEVTVGRDHEKQIFMVDERRCHGHSKVLERSLASRWIGKPKLVLPKENPKCFALYLRCVTVNRPDFLVVMNTPTKRENGRLVPTNEGESRRAMHRLCELWILASHLEDTRMQNATMDAIDLLRLTISLRTAEMVITNTIIGSGLRRWIGDFLSETMTNDWLTQWSQKVSKELLVDVLHASMQSREGKGKAGTTFDDRRPDHYHEH